ncbi:histidyl-tRNA synthetase [Caldimicrobium thiodismutans]|uniref:Histidine--tRNA ligase n=1 Tax=Caldimicrobium thiodismutans TaxID=1653476 RepID=A0A0U5AHL2_9BACT|nr:histidine--tRNA ligase [Caldimicrobium thiodismutans]BAU23379.1 histidyl-tRNA synthetase [Caldimicrobium thiodismutans]
MKLQSVRGFKDWLPEEAIKYQHLIEIARRELRLANFQEIKIPVLEKTELFVRSIGEVTDIVQKETYTFEDRNKELLTLRPEATAGICRMVIEHGLYMRPKPLKFFFIGPMFRHERPQKGRLREFFQIDVEFMGNLTPFYEVELLELALKILRSPVEGKRDPFNLEINSLGCPECRPAFRDYLLGALEREKEKLCETCKERLLRNPLRILDCKKEQCKEIVGKLRPISEFLCKGCKEHFEILKSLLEERGLSYIVNPYLVRGLDYYVRTIFEIKGEGLGAQDTVCAGGRYDFLIQELGGPELPATGFAIGLERWALCALGEEGLPAILEEAIKPQAVFIPLGDLARRKGLGIVKTLRNSGFKIDAFFEERSLKALLREADKRGVKFALILGENELKEGKILVKDLHKGMQKLVEENQLLEILKES